MEKMNKFSRAKRPARRAFLLDFMAYSILQEVFT